MTLEKAAKQLLLKNFKMSGERYIAPDKTHEDQWFWDSCFHSISCAHLGLKNLAINEIETLLKWQKEDGWIPHQIYKTKKRSWYDLERFFYKKEHRLFHSSIVGPPVIAQAAEAINEPQWIKKVLPSLIRFYLYFSEKRDSDNIGLVDICHPCESGRDTAPGFFHFRLNLRRSLGLFDQFLFFPFLYFLEFRYQRLNWDIDKIWEKNLFKVKDLMFNCIWIDGLRSLCRLISAYGLSEFSIKKENKIIQGTDEIIAHLKELADRAENAIYNLCWDEKDKIFCSLGYKNRKIKKISVSNLFPLILENIPLEMRQGLLGHLTNPEEFWTPYPIPSVPKNSPDFDTAHDYYCNWSGPTWINMNWFILRGLVKHKYMKEAEIIVKRTTQMIEKEGFWEFYNPISGKGMRKRTEGFGWSTLVVTFPKILKSLYN